MAKAKTTWDETCPHCGVKLVNLYVSFVAHDYYTQGYDNTCERCGKMIWVTVRTVPEFKLTAKEPTDA